jgi:hypothetical protein
MRRTFIRCIIENGMSLVATFLQLLITRWMLELSSVKEDLQWLEGKIPMFHVKHLKWYRFPEYHHQQNFWRIIHDSYQF